MTVDEIVERVAEIERIKLDDERAHSEEDRLHRDVLQAIAVGGRNARKLAQAALTTQQIGFSRWCA